MVGANSVLISGDPAANKVIVKNAGKDPISKVRLWVDGVSVSGVDSLSLASGSEETFDLSSIHGTVSADFPHKVSATFTDARGLTWRRFPHVSAKRTK